MTATTTAHTAVTETTTTTKVGTILQGKAGGTASNGE
jgi:hypothetical protein